MASCNKTCHFVASCNKACHFVASCYKACHFVASCNKTCHFVASCYKACHFVTHARTHTHTPLHTTQTHTHALLHLLIVLGDSEAGQGKLWTTRSIISLGGSPLALLGLLLAGMASSGILALIVCDWSMEIGIITLYTVYKLDCSFVVYKTNSTCKLHNSNGTGVWRITQYTHTYVTVSAKTHLRSSHNHLHFEKKLRWNYTWHRKFFTESKAR